MFYWLLLTCAVVLCLYILFILMRQLHIFININTLVIMNYFGNSLWQLFTVRHLEKFCAMYLAICGKHFFINAAKATLWYHVYRLYYCIISIRNKCNFSYLLDNVLKKASAKWLNVHVKKVCCVKFSYVISRGQHIISNTAPKSLKRWNTLTWGTLLTMSWDRGIETHSHVGFQFLNVCQELCHIL